MVLPLTWTIKSASFQPRPPKKISTCVGYDYARRKAPERTVPVAVALEPLHTLAAEWRMSRTWRQRFPQMPFE